jgi:hypothetical protein
MVRCTGFTGFLLAGMILSSPASAQESAGSGSRIGKISPSQIVSPGQPGASLGQGAMTATSDHQEDHQETLCTEDCAAPSETEIPPEELERRKLELEQQHLPPTPNLQRDQDDPK